MSVDYVICYVNMIVSVDYVIWYVHLIVSVCYVIWFVNMIVSIYYVIWYVNMIASVDYVIWYVILRVSEISLSCTFCRCLILFLTFISSCVLFVWSVSKVRKKGPISCKYNENNICFSALSVHDFNVEFSICYKIILCCFTRFYIILENHTEIWYPVHLIARHDTTWSLSIWLLDMTPRGPSCGK
jgi:hypothetical protein